MLTYLFCKLVFYYLHLSIFYFFFSCLFFFLVFFFFFQAEDGIRDLTVTGVQTCALPIFSSFGPSLASVFFLPIPMTLPVSTSTTPASTLVPPKSTPIASRPICAPPHRSEEHTSELQSQSNLVCRLLLEKKNAYPIATAPP